jgi:predicted RNase H-like nuclease (RuvC/YqgF family)
MGKPKYIYMTDENFIKLAGEENASALVNSLLSNHYRKIIEEEATPAEKDVKLAQEIEEKRKELELLQEEHTEIIQGQEDQKVKELEIQKEDDRIRELRQKWSDEVKSIPFDERPKFQDWVKDK